MRTRNTEKEALVKEKAIELLVQQGFDGFSMNKLAKASGISVATLYIYYQDKDDLIKKIGIEIGEGFFQGALKNFSPDMAFAEGLRLQWENRIAYTMGNKKAMQCWESLRHSPHNEYILEHVKANFKEVLGKFIRNAIQNGQLVQLPFEVFWSIAYGPLYTLLKFESEGKSVGGSPFTLTEEIKEAAFKTVIKALTP
jgi:TetR/AcrR family transcriptional regulator, multidrug resistance operon repressor